MFDTIRKIIWGPKTSRYGDWTEVSSSAKIGNNVEFGPWSKVGNNSVIGDNVKLGNWTEIGDNVIVGDGCIFGTHTRVADNTTIVPKSSFGDGDLVKGNEIYPGRIGGTVSSGNTVFINGRVYDIPENKDMNLLIEDYFWGKSDELLDYEGKE